MNIDFRMTFKVVQQLTKKKRKKIKKKTKDKSLERFNETKGNSTKTKEERKKNTNHKRLNEYTWTHNSFNELGECICKLFGKFKFVATFLAN